MPKLARDITKNDMQYLRQCAKNWRSHYTTHKPEGLELDDEQTAYLAGMNEIIETITQYLHYPIASNLYRVQTLCRKFWPDSYE